MPCSAALRKPESWLSSIELAPLTVAFTRASRDLKGRNAERRVERRRSAGAARGGARALRQVALLEGSRQHDGREAAHENPTVADRAGRDMEESAGKWCARRITGEIRRRRGVGGRSL